MFGYNEPLPWQYDGFPSYRTVLGRFVEFIKESGFKDYFRLDAVQEAADLYFVIQLRTSSTGFGYDSFDEDAWRKKLEAIGLKVVRFRRSPSNNLRFGSRYYAFVQYA